MFRWIPALRAEFTNEVQHRQVLPWERSTHSSQSKSAAALPAFKSKAALSGRSLQIWIARHRRSLARSTATPDARSDTAPLTPASRPKRAAGKAPSSKETPSCAKPSSTASSRVGRPSRSPAASPASRQSPASATRPSIASSTPRSPAPRTTDGGTISPEPRPNADADAKKAEAAQWTPSRPESPSHKGPPKPQTGKRRAIGKPTS